MGIFGSSEGLAAQKRAAQANVKKQAKKTVKQVKNINKKAGATAAEQIAGGTQQAVSTGPLALTSDYQRLLSGTPVLPAGITGTGLGINISPQGQVTATPSAERNTFLNQLTGGATADEQAYQQLLGQLAPGFGKVTEARRRALQDAARKAVGDLQANLQRRNVAGSSFAESQVGQLRAEYDKAIAEADAQSFLDELQATTELMAAKTKVRNDAMNAALGQINYETGQGNQILGNVQNAMSQANLAATDLAKTAAVLTAEGSRTAGTITGGLG